MGPEETKLKEWIKETAIKGMRDIRISFIDPVVKMLPREEFCKAVNDFIDASIREKPIASTTPDISASVEVTPDISGASMESTSEGISSSTSGISG